VWLKPKLVAAIEYAEWTPANHLRHSRFVVLRDEFEAVAQRGVLLALVNAALRT
jgi:ATP-dependent DNA ligase